MNESGAININLNIQINNAVMMLREDMQKYPSFDPTGVYEEKNVYMNRTNQLGLFLLRTGAPWAAEFYYRELLSEILEFEKTSGKTFNKGIAYANLGIAEMRSGKIDVGMAHLLMAEREDKPIQPTFDILNSPLWHQFEKPNVFKFLIDFSDNTIPFAIDDPFITSLVTNLEPQDRIFLESTLLSLLHNRVILQETLNSYSLGRLYSELKDICLLIESLLRKSQVAQGIFNPRDQRQLPLLLETAVGTQIFERNNARSGTSANDLETFLRKLEDAAAEIPIERSWLYYLVLVRNFTGHHFDISDNAQSPSGKTFFPQLYEIALKNVLLALLYLKHIGAY